MKNIEIVFLFTLLCLLASCKAHSEKTTALVAFYNLENLFDTIDAPEVIDEEFLPESEKKWGSERYNYKLDKLSTVISRIGENHEINYPDILGVCEVENSSVLADLVNTPKLKKANYNFVHFDSPDRRGIDVALLYNKTSFKVINASKHRLTQPNIKDYHSRDQLLVSGLFYGKPVHIIVNHWPSRRGGEEKSRPFRINAAKLCRSIIDSIRTIDSNANIMVMGDFNDDPNNESIVKHLKTCGSVAEMSNEKLFNPMDSLHQPGVGTLCYRGFWNLFDMIMVSEPLLKPNSQVLYQSARIYNPDYIQQKEGNYKGYPDRTFVGNRFLGGFSDHFPSYIILKVKR